MLRLRWSVRDRSRHIRARPSRPFKLPRRRREDDFIDDAKPVKYPTLAEIRAELAARGLPPLRDILAVEL